MPQRMIIFVLAILFIVVAAVALTAQKSGAQQAADECLTKPNSTPPQGSHWYYRVDQATRRHCWYLGPEGTKVRARQAGSPIKSRVKTSAPKQSTPPTETPSETTAPEIAPVKAASADAPTRTPAAGEIPPDVADHQAMDFSARWPVYAKSAAAVEPEPTSTMGSSSYADEPAGTPADVPSAGRTPESAVKSEYMLGLLAGALGLAAIFIGMVSKSSNHRRIVRRRFFKLWWPASKANRARDHVDDSFGDPLAAARRVDLDSKPVAKPRIPTPAVTKSTGSSTDSSNGSKRADPGHDLEASLQQLLRDWNRAAA